MGSCGPGAVSSRLPEVTVPVLGWGRQVGEQFEMDVIKILRNKLFPFLCYPDRCFGAITRNRAKELCSPTRNGFIESKDDFCDSNSIKE